MGKATKLLICLVLVLTAFGIIMLASASPAQAEKMKYAWHYFIVHQLVFVALALVAGAACALVDYRFWGKAAVPLTVTAVLLLGLLVTLHILGYFHIQTPLARKINGSWRWLFLGPVNFQPSELAKFAIICWLAWWMTRVRRRATEWRLGLAMPLLGLLLVVGLVFVEPDFGTTFLIAFVGMTLMYLGGSRFKHLAGSAFLLLVGFIIAIMLNPVRMRRILAFLWPEEYANKEAYQLMQALYAFVLGGPTGVGFGESIQKQHYLPEAHTDCIFAIIGEEWGLVATLAIALAFVVFFILGMRISFRAPDQFGRLLAFGLTLMITVQAAINIAVVTGCMPTKGLALPFISYGGSSILFTYVMIGVLINVGRQVDRTARFSDDRLIRDQQHDL
jgi:cell division protein FtsW